MMAPRVANNVDELAAVTPAWQALRARVPAASPNTDPDRFRATVVALEARPHVAVLGPIDAPHALLVGRINRRTPVVTLGYTRVPMPRLTCLDVVYGGILTDGSAAAAAAVTDYLVDVLRQGRVDSVFLNHVPLAEACAAATSGAALRSARGVTVVEPHWVTRLEAASFEDHLAQRSPKTRKTWKREGRRLEEAFGGAVDLAILSTPAELDQIFAGAAAITQQTYHAHIGNPFTDTPVWRAALRVEAERGTLRAFFLRGGGQPIAFYVGSVYGDRLIFDATGYLPQYARLSPGKHALLRIMAYAYEHRLRLLDWGFGDAEYKRIFGTEKWDEAVLHLYAPRLRPRLGRTIEWTTHALRVSGKKLAVQLGGLARIKRVWRGRLQRLEQPTQAEDAG